MAKKSFGAGATKPGILNTDGGEKLKEMQAKIQYNFNYIPKEKIVSNPKNEMYTQDGIEALKESILINGLRHNLSVLYNPDNDTYRLVSGERRYHAITSMSDKEYNDLFPAGIPCKVEKSEITEIDEEIMLISANHDVRESSMEVKRWEVSRLKELYTTAEKLIPELSELLNNNGIDLNQADKFGKLDEDAQKSILTIIEKNGKIDNAEFQSIKKISEERAKEAEQYKLKLDSALKELNEKEQTLKSLENKIKEISEKNVDDSKNDVEDQLRYMTEAKNKAEKEKARLETNLEKMKQLQKEREQRKTIIPDSELKRISSIAKAEQALTLFENNFDVIKNNKSIIKNDVDLKVRVEILSQRFNDFINSLN